MKKDIKLLRQYARLKKLPSVLYLGKINNNVRNDLLQISKTTPISNARGISNRSGVYDTSSPVGKSYNQKHLDNFTHNISCLDSFINMSEWRFAELDPDSVIPMHLDDPYKYRFMIILYGSHKFINENAETNMELDEVWFINPAYNHGVHNYNKSKHRIALLGKIEINEHNTGILRART